MGNAASQCNVVRQVRALIVACNYEGSSAQLNGCVNDGKNFAELCGRSGVRDIVTLYDDGSGDDIPTAENVDEYLDAMASRCGPYDSLIFFYAGHGTSVRDHSGDERDGMDEAFCLKDEFNREIELLLDDDFSEIISSSARKALGNPKILIITDCCHSGTIVDLDSKPELFDGLEVISLSGCKDHQTSAETQQASGEVGGVLTTTLLRSVSELQRTSGDDFTLDEVFRKLHQLKPERFEQQFRMSCSIAADPKDFIWPCTV